MLGRDLDPGPVEEAGSFGIVPNILSDFSKRGRIPNQVIEILALPKRAGASKKCVGLMSGIGLPGMQSGVEGMVPQRGKQDMDVIGHHAPGQ